MPLEIKLETLYSDKLVNKQLKEIKLVIGNNILNNNKVCNRKKKNFQDISNEKLKIINCLQITEELLNKISKDSFIISFEEKLSSQIDTPHKIVASANTQIGTIELARCCLLGESQNTICVTVDEDLSFLEQVRGNLGPVDRLLVVTSFPPKDGLKGKKYFIDLFRLTPYYKLM